MIERMRLEMADPETLLVVLRGRRVVFRDDIDGKTDTELLALIREKLT